MTVIGIDRLIPSYQVIFQTLKINNNFRLGFLGVILYV